MTGAAYEDLVVTCKDCSVPFVFTAGQQAYFADHQLLPPKRCERCRKVVRERHAAAVTNGRR
jgi:hypothetical protein